MLTKVTQHRKWLKIVAPIIRNFTGCITGFIRNTPECQLQGVQQLPRMYIVHLAQKYQNCWSQPFLPLLYIRDQEKSWWRSNIFPTSSLISIYNPCKPVVKLGFLEPCFDLSNARSTKNLSILNVSDLIDLYSKTYRELYESMFEPLVSVMRRQQASSSKSAGRSDRSSVLWERPTLSCLGQR